MAKREARPVPFCTRCRRPDSQPHADWCDGTPVPPPETPGPSPVIVRQGAPSFDGPPPGLKPSGPASVFDMHEDVLSAYGARGAAANRERIDREKAAQSRTPETASPPQPEPIETTAGRHPKEEPMASSIAEALEEAGLTNLPQPDAPAVDDVQGRICAECGVPQPIENFWKLKNGTRQPKCADCMKRALAAGRARGASHPVEKSEAAPAKPVAEPKPEHQVEPTALTHPAEMTLPELESERIRVVAYLAELDERIETAKALEALASYTDDVLRDMLALAVKQAKQIERALSVRGGAA